MFRGVLGVCIWCVYDVYTCITGVQGCKYSDEGVKGGVMKKGVYYDFKVLVFTLRSLKEIALL